MSIVVDRALRIDGEGGGGWLPGLLLLLLTVSSVGGDGSSGDEGERLELLIMFC